MRYCGRWQTDSDKDIGDSPSKLTGNGLTLKMSTEKKAMCEGHWEEQGGDSPYSMTKSRRSRQSSPWPWDNISPRSPSPNLLANARSVPSNLASHKGWQSTNNISYSISSPAKVWPWIKRELQTPFWPSPVCLLPLKTAARSQTHHNLTS